MTVALEIDILGVGLYTRGMTSFDEFCQVQADDFKQLATAEFITPKPAAIAPRERRRAGLMINLAVEVAHQACGHAGVDKTQVPSVFVSAIGDTAITDYMCRKLAQPEKLLSPTKFHNSVHNAPSGYWTISAANRAPSSFVGGFTESVGAGLLEAASQVVAAQQPVLAVFYDIANEPPFADLFEVRETLAVALVLSSPQSETTKHQQSDGPKSLATRMSFVPRQAGEVESMPKTKSLADFASANPMGPLLALVEQFAAVQRGGLRSPDLRFAAAPESWLEILH